MGQKRQKRQKIDKKDGSKFFNMFFSVSTKVKCQNCQFLRKTTFAKCPYQIENYTTHCGIDLKIFDDNINFNDCDNEELKVDKV